MGPKGLRVVGSRIKALCRHAIPLSISITSGATVHRGGHKHGPFRRKMKVQFKISGETKRKRVVEVYDMDEVYPSRPTFFYM